MFTGHGTIIIEGAVRIFVNTDISTVGHELFTLSDGAQLDLYIAGNVSKVGRLAIGNVRWPTSRAVRIYIGGESPIELDLVGSTRLEASVYAPRADITFKGNIFIRGALFANNLVGQGRVWVIYDGPCVTPPDEKEPPENDEERPDID